MKGKHFLKINASRDTYGIHDAIERTMSVGEYIQLLEDNYDNLDEPIVFWNDNGYTLGYVTEDSISNGWVADEDEEDEEN